MDGKVLVHVYSKKDVKHLYWICQSWGKRCLASPHMTGKQEFLSILRTASLGWICQGFWKFVVKTVSPAQLFKCYGIKSCAHWNNLQNTPGEQEFLQFSQTKGAYHSMKVSKCKLFWTEGEERCQSWEHSHLASNFFTHKSGWMPSRWSFDPKGQS